MNLFPGTKIGGFTVTRVRDIPGKDAKLVEMVFEKTRTELAWVKSSEKNKLFSITFKTLPDNSTGVFHILEHSVLCGSEKYPVREPFVELLKSSMNTFLNAMTFSDKTMYPVSSRSEQDFLNLTSVYLDAVFAPKILTNPNIFRQEGWHYEEDGDKLLYNGVVFNEMKGATSSVDDVVERNLQQLLFQDNSYGYNSGGDPEEIPNLTYEEFLENYRRNYHPSNARIFLDGDIPLEKTLALIEGYLSRFDLGYKQEITSQTPKAAEKTVYYEVSSQEELSGKTQIVLGKILGSWRDKTKCLAAQVLCDVLAGSNDAPLKRKILAAGLGQDVTMTVQDGVDQPWLVLRVHNTDDENAGVLRTMVTDTVRELVEKGIDKQELTASINHLEYYLKDMDEPQALIRCIFSMNSWLYGGDPMMYLTFDDGFAALREMAAGDDFERLLASLLLEEDGICVLHVLPSVTYGEECRKEESDRLAARWEAMTDAELGRLRAENESLSAWQQTPDSPGAIATLPVLSLDEVPTEPAQLNTVEETVSGVTVLRHTASTNGIVHFTAYFYLTDLSLEELTAASFLAKLLGKLPTRNYDAAALQTAIKTHIGSLDFDLDAVAKAGQVDACRPRLVAQCSVLRENLATAQALVAEILTGTRLDEPVRIREILMQTEMEAQQAAIMGGHVFAAACAQSHFSAQNAVTEAVSGYSLIRWIHDFVKNFDEKIGSFTALSARVLENAVCAARLILSVTEDAPTDMTGFVEELPAGTTAPQETAYKTALPEKLGIRIPAQVSFACTGYHLAQCGAEYNGTIRLLSNIVSLSYLWNMVRVQGGAYGAGMHSGRGGSIFCYSYRDPSPDKTLNTYQGIGDFVKAFHDSGEDLTKFIISTVAGTEPLVSPRQEGAIADSRWFAGLSYEDAVQERRELLSATQEDLVSWGDMLARMAREAGVCVMGHSEALGVCQGLTIVDL